MTPAELDLTLPNCSSVNHAILMCEIRGLTIAPGAEGTLGIVTEVTIRLAPRLPTTVAIAQFPDVKRATEAVRDILNTGVLIQCVELCDDDFMRATNVYGVSDMKYPELDSLFFKFQGTPETIKETSRVVKEIVERHGGSGFTMAKTKKQADDLWQDRKNALFSSLALVPGAMGWSTDVCGAWGILCFFFHFSG